MDIIFKAAFAGGVIAFASWLAEKRPDLAGFILALPLASIIALVITQIQLRIAQTLSFLRRVFLLEYRCHTYFLYHFSCPKFLGLGSG